MKTSPVIVVGAGISGLTTCLKLNELGFRVQLFSLLPAVYSDSQAQNSGFSAVLTKDQEEDSINRHFVETVYAGDFLAHQDQAWEFCQQAPEMLNFLERIGIRFDRDREGFLKKYRSEGSRAQRTYLAGEATGQQILQALDQQVRARESEGWVERFERWEVVSLWKGDQEQTAGVVAIDTRSLKSRVFESPAVVVCSGGLGGLYPRSLQSNLATGSLVAQLYQQGAWLANPEMIQFHPLGVDAVGSSLHFSHLAAQGRFWVEGDQEADFLLEKEYPEYGNLIPYDLTSRLLHQKTQANPNLAVYFQVKSEALSDLTKKRIESAGVKFREEEGVYSFPVSTLSSYWLGGLWTNEKHQTNIKGLFAAGEACYQYHGAYALESNIFNSSLVGGVKAAEGVADYLENLTSIATPAGKEKLDKESLRQQEKNREIFDLTGQENLHLLWGDLRDLLWDQVGLVRGQEKLKQADEELLLLKDRFHKMTLSDRSPWMNQELLWARRFLPVVDLARAMTLSALTREESRGVHYREDFPERNDEKFLKTSKVSWTRYAPQIEYEEVNLKFIRKPTDRDYS